MIFSCTIFMTFQGLLGFVFSDLKEESKDRNKGENTQRSKTVCFSHFQFLFDSLLLHSHFFLCITPPSPQIFLLLLVLVLFLSFLLCLFFKHLPIAHNHLIHFQNTLKIFCILHQQITANYSGYSAKLSFYLMSFTFQ